MYTIYFHYITCVLSVWKLSSVALIRLQSEGETCELSQSSQEQIRMFKSFADAVAGNHLGVRT